MATVSSSDPGRPTALSSQSGAAANDLSLMAKSRSVGISPMNTPSEVKRGHHLPKNACRTYLGTWFNRILADGVNDKVGGDS